MSEPTVIRNGLREHPAVRAWAQLRGRPAEPAWIEVLDASEKSTTYRLVGVGPNGGSVIAKRSRRGPLSPEVVVHLQIHPRLRIRTVTCYGFVEPAEDELSTLFLEDAGPVRYSPHSPHHRRLAGRWLAALHAAVAAASIDRSQVQLPWHGPAHYLRLLRSARDTFGGWDDAPPGDCHPGLATLLASRCDDVCARWQTIAELSASPTSATLVHGDLTARNIHLWPGTDAGSILLAVDWEHAAFGSPAVDLAQSSSANDGDFAASPDLDAYSESARAVWNSLDRAAVARLAAAGTIFRTIDGMCWATERVLCGEWWLEGDPEELSSFHSTLGQSLADLDRYT